MSVDPGPDRRTPKRQSAGTLQGTSNALDVRTHLLRPAAQLLAKRDRHGVHQVGAARLDDVIQLFRLDVQRLRKVQERGQKPFRR